eukprot:CAMPEP_0184859996 /NCGR_PEP_ID=MMETSP0580-20130426/4954_1 /TAXON_ID=1118495 /ORGANISM="Dactyliosolen fragilissimus" /LENGTH=655 /DNA_ID=CAMNT_0027356923 /DNA_START=37 /DNA_END=2004 /DNA_ORIENTATION=+
MVELSAETKGVMKLTLVDGGGTHRIALSKLWDSSANNVSYERLVELAIKFNSTINNVRNSDCNVTITYFDEDGDLITISSDEELCDAFQQFVGESPPVLRAEAIVKQVDEHEGVDMNRKVSKNSKSQSKYNGKLTNGAKTCKEESVLKPVTEELVQGQEAEKVSKKQNEEEKNVTEVIPKKREVPEGFLADFIHGRHTCDGCLVTPIVGIRYHAKNLPDYDLCENCVDKYKGKDIIFKPMQQERDLQMQCRWKRKQDRVLRMQCRARDAFPGMRKGLQARRVVQNMDCALKEAIRRSLEDVGSNKVKSPTNSNEDLELKSTEQETSSNTSSKQENNDAVKDTDEEESTVPCQEVHVMSDIAPEDELENSKDSNSHNSKENSPVPTLIVEGSDSGRNENNKECNETVDDVKNVDSVKCGCSQNNSDTSFTEDAAGHGDVALAIANTLDHTANAISAIVTEVSGEANCDNCEKGKVDSSFTSEHVVTAEKDCQTILDSVQHSHSDISQENIHLSDNESDWQVLDEEGKEVAHDEMIAQAAQLLGSALFQSDVISNDENNQQMTKSSSTKESSCEDSKTDKELLSSLSSVPSSIESVSPISSVLLCRWEDELKQLHELGFLNDHKSIEAFERLEAANIGVDSVEPISINTVVEYLLSH